MIETLTFSSKLRMTTVNTILITFNVLIDEIGDDDQAAHSVFSAYHFLVKSSQSVRW